MINIWRVLVVAIIAFMFTTLDDFCVLVILFARSIKHEHMTSTHVIVGQVIAFSIIVGLSLIGVLCGKFIPSGYIEFIGFIPLLLGFKLLYDLIISECYGDHSKHHHNPEIANDETDLEHHDENQQLVPVLENQPLVKKRASKSEYEHEHENYLKENEQVETTQDTESDEDDDANDNFLIQVFIKYFSYCFNPMTLEVIVITLGNSGDNIALYLPIFAVQKSDEALVITLIVWYVMLVIWIILARVLVNCQFISQGIEEYGKYFMPFLFIGLGLYVLSDSILVTKYILHEK